MDFLFSKAIAANQVSSTLQGRADLINTLSFLLFIYFVLSALFAIKYLFLNFVIKNSPDLTLFFFLEKKKPRGAKGVSINVENKAHQIINYLKISIFDEKGKSISQFVSRDPEIIISLNPGKYEVTVEKFGYSPASTKMFDLKNKNLHFDLKMEQVEDAHSARSISLAQEIMLPFGLVLVLVGILLGLILPINFSFWLKILDLVVVILNIFVTIDLFNRNHYFRAQNAENKPIKNTKIDFLNSKGDPIKEFTSDKHGISKVFASSGFYKISTKRTKTRTIKVNETDFIHLKLKLD